MDYISRALEDRLRRYEKAYKATLVTGARQVGKSTLLKKVFPDRKYVSLDDPFLEQQAKQSIFLAFITFKLNIAKQFFGPLHFINGDGRGI